MQAAIGVAFDPTLNAFLWEQKLLYKMICPVFPSKTRDLTWRDLSRRAPKLNATRASEFAEVVGGCRGNNQNAKVNQPRAKAGLALMAVES